jgi:DNA replication and repair protein RecF
VGANGQGKTSFVEALSFLSTLRSFRESKACSVIQWGSSDAEISCSVVSEDPSFAEWKTELKVSFHTSDPLRQKATKVACINDKPYKSSTQYLSQRFGSYQLGFHSIIFNPADHDLVRGDPATRRAYLDRVLSAENVEYLKALQKYQRVLEQRNSLLKAQGPYHPSSPLLASFTDQLCKAGSYLAYQRLSWIQKLNQILDHKLQQIAPRQPTLKLFGVSNWAPEVENLSINNGKLQSIHFTGQGQLPSLELLERSFWDKVSELSTAEWRAGHSLVGPHRDDWTFFLGDQVLKGYGSQGEVRSALLALKLSEIELFRNETQHRPLFLLDDFSSELDSERRSFLIRFLENTDLQTFVTTTEDSFFTGRRYWVSNGAIREGMHDNGTEAVKFE